MFDKTMTFSVNEDKEAELRKNLTIICKMKRTLNTSVAV